MSKSQLRMSFEDEMADRRSFREFCGLGLAYSVPDETALVCFCAQLVARGRMVKSVTLVDATIVEGGAAQTRGRVPD